MIEFKLPSLGADMDDDTLLEWKVGVGDTVTKGQVIAVVDTAKAAVDVECWTPGTVHELVAEVGQKMPVGTVMAILSESGEKVSACGTAAVSPAAPTARRMISPAARKHAEKRGIDLDAVVGSGPNGAVTLDDVENAAAQPSPVTAPKPAATPDKSAEMRKAIAAAMARSKREIPHYYVAEDISLAKALAWLQAENLRRPMAERLLPAAVLLKAVAVALAHYPELNGFFRDGSFAPAAKINLGVAISLRQGGLIAPALLDAGARNVTQIMQGLMDLVKRTRAGSLKSSEMSEATITVTNLGDQGSQAVFGVIYPPQVALVGFGRVAERPWGDAEGGLKALPVVTATLAADHRVSDGHRGALFLRELAELLQHPEELEGLEK
jgi:pyruvate dehydrogenase E2 component (dihydrolipoamide acetyltransferase)